MDDSITMFLIGGLLSLAVFFAVLAYRADRKSRLTAYKLQIERIERAGYELQFDMHGLFNQLNSMGAGLFVKEAAQNYDKLTEYSRHLRDQLSYRHKVLWSVGEELDFVAARVEWYAKLHSIKIVTDFRTDSPATANAKIPALLLYAFADNSLRHGIKNKGDDGNLGISIMAMGRQMMASISDNGVGQKAAMEANHNTNGKGSRLVRLYESLFAESESGGLEFTRRELHPGETHPGMLAEVKWNPRQIERSMQKIRT